MSYVRCELKDAIVCTAGADRVSLRATVQFDILGVDGCKAKTKCSDVRRFLEAKRGEGGRERERILCI
eukprot:COSAG02_NODE_382_length_23409_cov_45.812999_4_plen_68_part_00